MKLFYINLKQAVNGKIGKDFIHRYKTDGNCLQNFNNYEILKYRINQESSRQISKFAH